MNKLLLFALCVLTLSACSKKKDRIFPSDPLPSRPTGGGNPGAGDGTASTDAELEALKKRIAQAQLDRTAELPDEIAIMKKKVPAQEELADFKTALKDCISLSEVWGLLANNGFVLQASLPQLPIELAVIEEERSFYEVAKKLKSPLVSNPHARADDIAASKEQYLYFLWQMLEDAKDHISGLDGIKADESQKAIERIEKLASIILKFGPGSFAAFTRQAKELSDGPLHIDLLTIVELILPQRDALKYPSNRFIEVEEIPLALARLGFIKSNILIGSKFDSQIPAYIRMTLANPPDEAMDTEQELESLLAGIEDVAESIKKSKSPKIKGYLARVYLLKLAYKKQELLLRASALGQ